GSPVTPGMRCPNPVGRKRNWSPNGGFDRIALEAMIGESLLDQRDRGSGDLLGVRQSGRAVALWRRVGERPKAFFNTTKGGFDLLITVFRLGAPLMYIQG